MLASSPESIAAWDRACFDACALFRPPEKLTVAEWADKYLYLSPEGSARPGKYYVSTAEYQREPLECLSPDSGFDEVVQCWSSQTGKTQNALSLTGFHTKHDPAPILFLEPDENLAKAIAQDRINPMIRDTPVLSPLFSNGKGKGNDTLHKSYPGGQLDIGWASSPTGLASRPKRIVITDEEDAYVLAANKEGDPIGIVQARMATYSELGIAKHLRVSSPRLKRTSKIWKAFLNSDQRHYYVPCPQCGHMQTLRWEQLKWPPDEPSACYYVCEANACVIEHKDKFRMVRQGKWIAHNPKGGNGRTAGFHLNALYSTIGFSWSKLVEKFNKCEGIPDKIQVFVNTLLGLPWDEEAEGADLNVVQKRAEEYEFQAPAWSVLFTVGADVQKDRIEATRWGYGLQEQSGVIEHRIFDGDPLRPDVWEAFDTWRLQIDDPGKPGYIHFPSNPEAGCDRDYYAQLTAEKLVTHQTRSGEKATWEKQQRRNEALDCAVYALAARWFIPFRMQDLARALEARAAKLKPEERPGGALYKLLPVARAVASALSSGSSPASPLPAAKLQQPIAKKGKKRFSRPGFGWIHG